MLYIIGVLVFVTKRRNKVVMTTYLIDFTWGFFYEKCKNLPKKKKKKTQTNKQTNKQKKTQQFLDAQLLVVSWCNRQKCNPRSLNQFQTDHISRVSEKKEHLCFLYF